MSVDSRHNVIILALFTLMLPMAMVLVANLGIFPAFYDEDQSNALANPTAVLTDINNWGWESLVSVGTGVFAFIAVVVFRMSVGAAIYSVAFAFFGTYSTNLMTFLEGETFGFPPYMTTIISVALTAIFLYAFIRLAST